MANFEPLKSGTLSRGDFFFFSLGGREKRERMATVRSSLVCIIYQMSPNPWGFLDGGNRVLFVSVSLRLRTEHLLCEQFLSE